MRSKHFPFLLVKYDHNFWPSWVGSISALLIETLGCKVGIKKSTLWLFYVIFRFENVSGLWCLSLWIIQVNYTMILQDWGNYIGTGVRDRFTTVIKPGLARRVDPGPGRPGGWTGPGLTKDLAVATARPNPGDPVGRPGTRANPNETRFFFFFFSNVGFETH